MQDDFDRELRSIGFASGAIYERHVQRQQDERYLDTDWIELTDSARDELIKALKTKQPKFDHKHIPAGYLQNWGGSARFLTAFIRNFLKELRNIICKSKSKLPSRGAVSAKEVAAGVAGYLTGLIGTSAPLAVGIGAVVVLTLSTATKRAFCNMTDEQVLKVL
ncbi:hypothetical protein GCM10007874_11520 [Labrys miyagiensis]|uniref:Uncharacterized protein n=1 Tax=Labrys miyagiensis TaxID=346912 RepID=A0ABQ6CD02_9HYPH|nr:hypothetical protein [Labrys miyagiensis]GLS18136.1 hypothetical protein GCM10007874_11520 [Labrys miyagiensis]